MVAIPFSSGLCSFDLPQHNIQLLENCRNPFFIRSVFVRVVRQGTPGTGPESQSLFHQVCVRSQHKEVNLSDGPVSQSLFHQVCVRSIRLNTKKIEEKDVAIPFSSGLCSFDVRQAKGLVGALASQSLFHQVCVRSSLLSVLWTETLSQSLFHQVCVRSSTTGQPMRCPVLVAIPFSSGLCSFGKQAGEGGGVYESRNPFFIRSVFVQPSLSTQLREVSQSLFHQVCVRSLFRAASPHQAPLSQSLFHQVCVRSKPLGRTLPEKKGVAIPFSSGLCSFRR